MLTKLREFQRQACISLSSQIVDIVGEGEVGEVHCSEAFSTSATVEGGRVCRGLELVEVEVLIEELRLVKLVNEGVKSAKVGYFWN